MNNNVRIGVELNGIVRNINKQIVKYYKDINHEFDEDTISLNKTSIIEELKFDSKLARNEFLFTDYPYEIYGCANPMERNLPATINKWMLEMANKKNSVTFFSLRENDLSIPSTLFFLSKIALRCRNIVFPISTQNIWDDYDIIITTNKDIVNTKPSNKTVVLIVKDDNVFSKNDADYAYDSLEEMINKNVIVYEKKNQTIISKITNFFKKIRYGK